MDKLRDAMIWVFWINIVIQAFLTVQQYRPIFPNYLIKAGNLIQMHTAKALFAVNDQTSCLE